MSKATPCGFCQKTFQSKRRSNGKWTQCCSKSCARKMELAAGAHAFQKAPRYGKWTPAPEFIRCGSCGADISSPGHKQRFCRPCRKVRQSERGRSMRKRWPSWSVWFPTCATCREVFTARQPKAKYCSEDCSMWQYRNRPCRDCGSALGEVSLKLYCDDCAALRKAATRRAYKAKRRALMKDAGAEHFDPHEIYERDGWRCGICRKRVNPNLEHPNPMSASLDHIVPLAGGGAHTRINTQCSHLACNREKWHTGWGQPLLFA